MVLLLSSSVGSLTNSLPAPSTFHSLPLTQFFFKGAEGQQEQQVSLDTLYYVLYTLSVAMAPFTPFFTEYVYQNLRKLQPAEKREDSTSSFLLNPPSWPPHPSHWRLRGSPPSVV